MDLLLVLVVVLIIVLVWRGPSVLPQLGAALGKAVKGVRDNVNADAAQGKSTDATTAADDRDVKPRD